jgi:hypothetical protein
LLPFCSESFVCDQIKEDEVKGHKAHMGEMNAYNILVGNPEG